MAVADVNYDGCVVRWEPNSRGRLEQAAMALYAERGFEQTTVAEIAGRAGLTERTFFRHFADKREVLFAGAEVLEQRLVEAVAGAPAGLSPIEAATSGIEAAAEMLQERRAFARQRQAIIAATPELQERELIKLASLSAALAGALRGRGVAESTASLAAEVAIAVFRIAFDRWTADDDGETFPELIRSSLDELRAVTREDR
jgi:AcrR family transcriptional regulator